MAVHDLAKPRALRVLVVENHPDTLHGIMRFLEMMEHQVHPARSMAEALDQLTHGSYDVLLSDIGLPDGTGWDLLQAAQRHRPPYAIAMSGFGFNADRARSAAAGFRHHLTKPFDPEELENMLDEAARELAAPASKGSAQA